MPRSYPTTQAAACATTRREFLGAAALAGAGALLGPAHATGPAPPALPLITKPIPASGERLPAVGIGSNEFRESVRDEVREELKRMSELGGSVIDTAAAYGDSETVIGAALATLGTRAKMFVATKLVAGGASTPDRPAGSDSFERSLERLQTRRLDLLQVHNLNGVAELLPLLLEWKKAGRIRYIGATTSRGTQHAQLLQTMRAFPLDFIQVDYSLDNRDAAEAILPLAIERQQAVLVNLPFGRAALFRAAATRTLPPWAAEIDVSSWAQYFLKYVISHPAVTCAIPGSTKLSHLIDNQGAGRGRLPDAPLRKRMEEFWDHPV
jgi:aryl-alcohol dehydrogenase-like predicted oxidoreductase